MRILLTGGSGFVGSYVADQFSELGHTVRLTLDKVNELKHRHWVCSGEAARRDLNWAPQVQWPKGVKLSADWYRKEGWL